MKICLINNLYKPYSRGGGAERITEIMVQELIKNHEVFVISTCPHFPKSGPKVYYIKSMYYYLNKIPKIFRVFWHIFDIFDFLSAAKINNILEKEKPDLVITHNLKGLSFLIPKKLKKLKKKHIHILHDIQLIHPSGLMYYKKERDINNILNKIYYKTCRQIFGSPDIVISPSAWLLSEHTKKGFFKKSNKHVIPNPVILNKEVKNKEIFNKDLFNFLYVGQIEKHKGVKFLIKTFKEFNKEEKCCLNIVGDGSILNELKELAKNNVKIVFLGKQSSEEVSNSMQKADCLIVPSFCYENSPTVIYEAAANNLPVIASEIGGIPELINELGGLLFEPNNKEELIKKMDYIINNKIEIQSIKLKEFEVNKYIERVLKTS